jgi:type IV secretory pathway VirB10-like protein
MLILTQNLIFRKNNSYFYFKILNKLKMKKIVLMMLLAVSFTTFAQEKMAEKNHDHKEQMSPENRLKKMTKELNLTPTQQTQIKELLIERQAQHKAIKEKRHEIKDLKEKGEDVKQMRQENRAQAEAEFKVMDEKMKTILDKDQYAKWAAKVESMKAKHKKK